MRGKRTLFNQRIAREDFPKPEVTFDLAIQEFIDNCIKNIELFKANPAQWDKLWKHYNKLLQTELVWQRHPNLAACLIKTHQEIAREHGNLVGWNKPENFIEFETFRNLQQYLTNSTRFSNGRRTFMLLTKSFSLPAIKLHSVDLISMMKQHTPYVKDNRKTIGNFLLDRQEIWPYQVQTKEDEEQLQIAVEDLLAYLKDSLPARGHYRDGDAVSYLIYLNDLFCQARNYLIGNYPRDATPLKGFEIINRPSLYIVNEVIEHLLTNIPSLNHQDPKRIQLKKALEQLANNSLFEQQLAETAEKMKKWDGS